ncbi:ATP-dependent DNA ligase [Bacillus safensis]|uniref:ATP-dependent DNA ligase n=1 Tax=Bacillus safensis TaxID=561879 RepID=UPI0020CE3E74|nr:RNA ligase family protein [Bacillus safensis]MCP9283587.1 ATP-dependent DNA ligase [Bacillus safensis]
MFVSPMLLHSIKEPFNDDSYITELKFDGIRLILSKFNDQIKLFTRHNNEVTSKFPELLDLDIPNGTVLDGEVIVAARDGAADFEAMMERFMSKKSDHSIVYCVFDVIFKNGDSIAAKPLSERKNLLYSLNLIHPNVYVIEGIKGNASEYFNLTKEKNLEGIVLKRADSPYEINKRSRNWLKVINYEYTEVLITGYTKEDIKFLLSYPDGSSAGFMEFMPYEERSKFHSIKQVKSETDEYVFIDPIVCKVKHRFKTKHGKLRIPSFESWRA